MMAEEAMICLLLLMLPLLHKANEIFSVCGQPLLSPRIVGGQEARVGAWPWQVSIQRNGKHFCGGSLVTQEWVMSAAHCFKQGSQPGLTVTLGEYQLENTSTRARTIPVIQVIRNIAFHGTGTPGDIALLKLLRPLEYTPYILPVCIPDASAEFPEGMNCWVTGWGAIRSGEPLPSPKTLQEVEVIIIGVNACNQLFNISMPSSEGSTPILDSMICAGYEAGKKDACQGDSGGPLVCAQNNSWFLAGLVSWGEGCALPNRPGVYTRVTSYTGWLQSHISNLRFGVVPITLRAGGNNVHAFPAVALLSCSIAILLPLLQLGFMD